MIPFNHQPHVSKSLFVALIALAVVALGACAPSADSGSSASIQIVQPQDGAQYAVGEAIEVISQFSDAGGTTNVILQVSSGFTRGDDFSSPVAQGSINQLWRPDQAGSYTLQTFLTASDGSKIESNLVQITIGDAATEEEAPALGAEATATPTPIPATVIALQTSNCRLGPSSVFDANAVLEGGQSAPAVGRLADDSWWLVAHPDGGQCWIFDELVSRIGDFSQVPVVTPPPTPTPTPTATPTPVPIPAPQAVSPSGGVGCVSSVFLTWNPVSHPNGIDHYEWQVSGAASDSGSTANTQIEFFVACSASYEWSVRAVDGDGNVGPYSNPLSFDTN